MTEGNSILTTRWAKAGAVVIVVALLTGATWLAIHRKGLVRRDVERYLSTIAELKTDQIAAWLDERMGDAGVLMGDPLFTEAAVRWLADPVAEDTERIRTRLTGDQLHHAYDDVLLADAAGRTHLSLRGATGPLDTEAMAALAEAKRERHPVMTDLHSSGTDGTLHIGVIIPLFAMGEHAEDLVGVVILVSNFEQFLLPVLRFWPLSSESSESVIVRRDGDGVIILSGAQQPSEQARQQRIPLEPAEVPAVMAVRGRQGVVQTRDHRGTDVIAVISPIPDSPWFMITKQSTAEAFAAWRFRSALALALALVSVGLVCAVVLFSRQRDAMIHYRALFESEANRRAIEARQATVLKNIADGVIAVNTHGHVELLNTVAEELTGWSNEEARGRPLDEVFRIFNEHTLNEVENPAIRVLREGHVVGLANHTALVARDGTERAIVDSGAPIRDENGEISGVVLVFRDQTEERRAQRELRDSQQRLETLLNASPLALFETDAEGNCLYVNKKWCELAGLLPHEALGTGWQRSLHEDDLGAVLRLWNQHTPSGQLWDLEHRLRTPEGKVRWIWGTVAPLTDPEGQISGYIGANVDITERKQAEENYQTLFHEMLDAMAVHEMIRDEQGKPVNYRFVDVNPAFERLTGLKAADIVGRTVLDLLPETEPAWIERYGRVVLTGEPAFFEEYTRPLNRYFQVAAFRPAPNQFACTFVDVTDRERARQELQRYNARLRSMVEILQSQAPSVQEFLDFALDKATELTESKLGYIYLYDEDQRKFILNTWSKNVLKACSIKNPPACYELEKTGIWGEAVRQRRPIILNDFQASHPLKKGYPEGHAALHKYLTVPVFSGERIVAVVGVANKQKDYEESDVLQLTLLMDTVWRVVEQRKTEQSLRSIEWMLRSSSPDTGEREAEDLLLRQHGDLAAPNTSGAILNSIGPEVLLTMVREFVDMLGTSASVYEANGDHALGVFSSSWCRSLDAASRRLCHTEDDREALACGRWLCHESCWNGSSKMAVETGAPVDTECHGGLRIYAVPIVAGDRVIGAISIGYGDPPKNPATIIELAQRYEVDPVELTQHAHAYESRPAFIVNLAKRRVEASALLIGEMVERRSVENERKRLQAQLLQAQKMESVGRLAGGIAHDFNNMLGVILGNVELIMDRLRPDDPLRSDLADVQKAAQRSAELTRQLLAFARKQTICPQVLDLNDTVSGMLKMLRRLIGEDIDLRWIPAGELWPVKVDPVQISQVLANLCVNARDAINGVGSVTIETANASFDEAYCADHPGLVPGDYAMLAVSDDGCGMAPDVVASVFEPFFTTKQHGEGTGLGLATVYGIVKQNNGFINVYSEPGKGTTFKIYLVRHVGNVEEITHSSTPEAPKGRGETVLLVEDENAILVLGKRMLESLGYAVIAVGNPLEALRVGQAHDGDIHLLVTDVVMPQMNGRDLAARLHEIHPHLKTLFMSGYTANVIAHHGVLDPGIHFVQKPFSYQELAARVRESLDAP